MDLNFCGDCGSRAHASQAFCRSCGARLADIAPVDQSSERLREAVTRISTGDTAGACVSLEALVDAEPQNAVARAYLGVAYLRLTRVADAREALEQAVKLAPSSFICRAKYGEFLARLGFYDQALTQLDAALAVPPPNTESRLAALELRQHCRDKSRGLYYRPLRYPKLSVPFRRRAQRSVTLQGY